MIIYFADRAMQVMGQASTSLPRGFTASDDKKIEDIDSGVASFECTVYFEKSEQKSLREIVKAGNYILRKSKDDNELYTIIDSEMDIEKQEIYIYAEDAGLDLLNEIALSYEASEAHPIGWYIQKWTYDSGFEIGINEIPGISKKLKWDDESTVTERLASLAAQFDNAEISYSFDIDGLRVLHKYVNIYKSRGKDLGEQLRINKNLNNIIIKSSVANLATALYVTGGTPEGKDEPITLSGYSYDDKDIYTDGAFLKSRKALSKWSRFLSDSGTGEGHIIRTYNYDTTHKSELCSHAVAELKKICDTEVNYEVDIADLPSNVRIGDRVNLIDDNGQIYLSARILKLEISVTNDTQKATLGEYLIKDSGISEKVESLASQFAEMAKNRNFYTWIAYADDEKGTGITLDSLGKPYMGISSNRSEAEPDITDPSVYTWSKIQGDKGDLGLSLTGMIEHYLISSLSEGITKDTEGWSTDIPIMTSKLKYLWNYETLVYSDNSTEDLEPKIIGIYGDTGNSGEDAPYVVAMTEQYYLSASETELVGGEWVRIIPEWIYGTYLWTRWCTEWSKPNPDLLTYSDGVLSATWNEIHESANEAKIKAEEAGNKAEAVEGEVSDINTELDKAQQQLESIQDNLQTIEQTMTEDYATKGELTEINTALGTRIEQNAAEISQTVIKVQDIEIDASKAMQDAEAAQTAANQAAQTAAEAQEKYDELKEQADVTDEQLEAAKKAVEKAQADAVAAGDAAAAAQSAANSLQDRVAAAETNITQNAEQIELTAQKVTNMKIGGRNLILNSDIMEESSDFGFGERALSLELEADTEYSFSANGRVNAGDDGKSLVVKLLSEENTFMQEINITETEDITKSVVFTAPTGIENKDIKVMCYYSPQSADGTVLNGSCTVNWVKLEKGNRPTDWIPAPEDTNVKIFDSIENATTSILQTAENITMQIISGYTTSDDFEEYKQQVKNLFEASENGFEFQFNQLQESINAAGGEILEQKQFIRLEGGNVIIGNSESPVNAVFTNDSLRFLYNWDEKDDIEKYTIAKFTNNALEVRDVAVENQVRFGSDWAIRPGRGGNLNDVWIGG